MFNPFYPFTTELLESFLKTGKSYFVRQTLPNSTSVREEGIKGYFLISHYDRLVTAQDHFGAIEYDRNRFLYDWNIPEHRQRLQTAAAGPKDFRIYSSVFRADWEKHLDEEFQQKVRAYVNSLDWRPKKGEVVDTRFELHFGELFLRLKYGGRIAKIKFEELENPA